MATIQAVEFFTVGTEDDDTITGRPEADLIDGRGGSDLIFGQEGADTILGGPGPDDLFGGGEDDVLFGGAEGDGLLGGSGDDRLDGGAGNDSLNGDVGDDTLQGRSGSDFLVGAEGADTFVFNFAGIFQGAFGDPAQDNDIVFDFERGSDAIRVIGLSQSLDTDGNGQLDDLDARVDVVRGIYLVLDLNGEPLVNGDTAAGTLTIFSAGTLDVGTDIFS